jgi:hypothetical protein
MANPRMEVDLIVDRGWKPTSPTGEGCAILVLDFQEVRITT